MENTQEQVQPSPKKQKVQALDYEHILPIAHALAGEIVFGAERAKRAKDPKDVEELLKPAGDTLTDLIDEFRSRPVNPDVESNIPQLYTKGQAFLRACVMGRVAFPGDFCHPDPEFHGDVLGVAFQQYLKNEYKFTPNELFYFEEVLGNCLSLNEEEDEEKKQESKQE